MNIVRLNKKQAEKRNGSNKVCGTAYQSKLKVDYGVPKLRTTQNFGLCGNPDLTTFSNSRSGLSKPKIKERKKVDAQKWA